MSITCTDQLVPSNSAYELRFSRSGLSKEGKVNPHEDAEPFLRNILHHGRLSTSLHELVALLRDSLPIVVELEEMRKTAARNGESIDTFAKAAGWFRLLYGDLRCGLFIFRLGKC